MNLLESKEVLKIADLRVQYPTDRGTVRAVRGWTSRSMKAKSWAWSGSPAVARAPLCSR